MAGKPKSHKNRKRQEYLDNLERLLGEPVSPDLEFKVVNVESLVARASTERLGVSPKHQRILRRVQEGMMPEQAARSEGIPADVFWNQFMKSEDKQFRRFREFLDVAEGQFEVAILKIIKDPLVEPSYRNAMVKLLQIRFPHWSGHSAKGHRLEDEKTRADIELKKAQTESLKKGESEVGANFTVVVRRRDPAEDLTREKIKSRQTQSLEPPKDDDIE